MVLLILFFFLCFSSNTWKNNIFNTLVSTSKEGAHTNLEDRSLIVPIYLSENEQKENGGHVIYMQDKHYLNVTTTKLEVNLFS